MFGFGTERLFVSNKERVFRAVERVDLPFCVWGVRDVLRLGMPAGRSVLGNVQDVPCFGACGASRDPPTVWKPVAVFAATRLQDVRKTFTGCLRVVREMCARRGDTCNSLRPVCVICTTYLRVVCKTLRPVCDSFAICGDTRNSSRSVCGTLESYLRDVCDPFASCLRPTRDLFRLSAARRRFIFSF